MPDTRQLLIGLAIILAAGWAAFAALGLDLVPFHPDETSMLYQSRDLESLFHRPEELAWAPDKTMTTALEYRLINAPLPKYLVGAARAVTGHSPDAVSTDWNWSRSWNDNLEAGGVPPAGALLAGRAANLVALTFAGLALAGWGLRAGGWRLAVLTLVSFLLSGYQLLHGRRAMAEGTLLAAVSLWLYATTYLQSKPWILGLASGLSLTAKHSAVPLLLIGFLAALIDSHLKGQSIGRSVRSAALFAVPAIASIILLSPVYWSHPIGALTETIRLRSDLVFRQNQELEARGEASTLDSPVERLAGAVGLLFVTDLQYQEVGNYREALQKSISIYESVPGHRLDRGLLAGAFRLVLFGAGAVLAIRSIFRPGQSRPGIALLVFGAAAQAAALIVFNPLPFQRYYAPLLPFVHALGAWAVYMPFARAPESRSSFEPEHEGGRGLTT